MPIPGLQTVVCRAVVRLQGRAAGGGGGDAMLRRWFRGGNQWGRGGWRRASPAAAARLSCFNAAGHIFEMGLERRAGAAVDDTIPFAAPTHPPTTAMCSAAAEKDRLLRPNRRSDSCLHPGCSKMGAQEEGVAAVGPAAADGAG